MLYKIFKKLNFKQLFGLLGMFLKNPLFAIPTILATQRCMQISYKEYGSKHHLSNQANAFRHALWNILIVKRCLQWKNNEAKAIDWALTFTNWHEDFSPNEALDQAMDIHNNRVGVGYLREIISLDEFQVVLYLKTKASEAQQIKSVSDIENYPDQLVFIE